MYSQHTDQQMFPSICEFVHMWPGIHPLLGLESRAMCTFTIELHSYGWQLVIQMTKPLSMNLHYITILPFNCTFLNTSHTCELVSWTVSVLIQLSAHTALERGFFLWNEWDHVLQWRAHRARWSILSGNIFLLFNEDNVSLTWLMTAYHYIEIPSI